MLCRDDDQLKLRNGQGKKSGACKIALKAEILKQMYNLCHLQPTEIIICLLVKCASNVDLKIVSKIRPLKGKYGEHGKYL